MNKSEAVAYLHKSKGYSRRMSAKIVDIALMQRDSPFIGAFKAAIEKSMSKEPEKVKYVIDLEKARTKNAKDKVKRKKKETVKSYMKRYKANNDAVNQHNERVAWLKNHKVT